MKTNAVKGDGAGVRSKSGAFMASESLMEAKHKTVVRDMATLARRSCAGEHLHTDDDDHFCGYVRIAALLEMVMEEWTVKAAKEREKVRTKYARVGRR